MNIKIDNEKCKSFFNYNTKARKSDLPVLTIVRGWMQIIVVVVARRVVIMVWWCVPSTLTKINSGIKKAKNQNWKINDLKN